MTQPITLDTIISYQAKKLHRAKRERNISQTYAEKYILEVLIEHRNMIKNENGNVVVHMSPERFKLIENIRPTWVTLDDQSD